MGFPETWPWSHIITPNSDGKTDVIGFDDSFVPLPHSVTEATPDSSPTLSHRRLSNPFRVSGDFTNVNPFDDSFVPLPHSPSGPELLPQANGRPPHDIRHCTSETNLSKLKKEYQPLRTLGEVEPLVTRSEEDLLSSTADSRHCMVDGDNHR